MEFDHSAMAKLDLLTSVMQTVIYSLRKKKEKKKKLDDFTFSVLSWILRNQTYDINIFLLNTCIMCT